MEKRYIPLEEIKERTELNFKRMSDDFYDIDHVFAGDDAEWPGDKEGRALLAFVSLYKITGRKIPCMELMMNKIPEITSSRMFFGAKTEETLFEQQLSGTSWYLRGLCEYYEQFGDERAIDYLNKTFDGIYLPTRGKYSTYPIKRNIGDNGGVDGHSIGNLDGWRLSTDIGCAFMSLDGLSHYYAVTLRKEAKEIIDEMAEVFDKTDKYTLQAQTHCTLTAARGFMRMYGITNDKEYLEKAKRIFDLYVQKGMTYTYQNFNWFGKGDTWTEPCAIVDSLMLATELYLATQSDMYRMYAARIYFNGFATLQRPNGGAGTDTTVSETTAVSEVKTYEAKLCCSMRLSEGLRYIAAHREDIFAEVSGKITKDEHGIYRDTDILYCEIPEHAEKYAEKAVSVDGHRLFPLIKLYKLQDEAECRSVTQKITFKD